MVKKFQLYGRTLISLWKWCECLKWLMTGWLCVPTFREIIETMVKAYQQKIFFKTKPVFDGRKNLYSRDHLPIGTEKVGSVSLSFSCFDSSLRPSAHRHRKDLVHCHCAVAVMVSETACLLTQKRLGPLSMLFTGFDDSRKDHLPIGIEEVESRSSSFSRFNGSFRDHHCCRKEWFYFHCLFLWIGI